MNNSLDLTPPADWEPGVNIRFRPEEVQALFHALPADLVTKSRTLMTGMSRMYYAYRQQMGKDP